jgi:hypothetical protein
MFFGRAAIDACFPESSRHVARSITTSEQEQRRVDLRSARDLRAGLPITIVWHAPACRIRRAGALACSLVWVRYFREFTTVIVTRWRYSHASLPGTGIAFGA